jgi:type I restriction enzyme S subunit
MSKIYKQISELGEIITGKTPSTANNELWGGDIPFITPTDIKSFDSYYQNETERSVSDVGAQKQIKTILPKNSVCVSCIATIGKMCLTRCKSITNQQINSIIPNKENDYRYILYMLRYNLPYIQLVGGGSGSGTPIISKNNFSRFKFLIEDNLPIQRRIASILSAYDNLIENNNKRIRLLEQIAENLYKEWFVRFRFPGHENAEFENGLPKGWREEVASNVIDVMSGGTPKTEREEFYGGEIPFFTPKDADDSIFVYSTITNITEEGLAHCNSQYYPVNTLMITARGTVGKLSLLAVPMAMNQSCFALSFKDRKNPYYLYYSIKNEVSKLKKMANGGVFDTIIVKTFDHIKVILPHNDVLDIYDKTVSPILSQIQHLQRQSSLLSRQRDLLLPRLMSGKLEVKK